MQITDGCDDLDFVCGRIIFTSVWAIIVICIACGCLMRLYSLRQRFCYEMLPLISSGLQACLHLFQYIFIRNNQIIVITNYIQIVTFAFIGQSFANLYYRMTCENGENYKKKFQIVFGIQILFYLVMLIVMIFQLTQMKQNECTNDFKAALGIILTQIGCTCIFTTVYGCKLLKSIRTITRESQDMKKSRKIIMRQQKLKSHSLNRVYAASLTSQRNETFLLQEDDTWCELITEKKKQIRTIIIGLSTTTVLYIVVFPIILSQREDILCTTERDDWDNLIQCFLSILQMTPCIYLSFAFYYILTVERAEADDSIRTEDFKLDTEARKESFYATPGDDFVQQMMNDAQSHK